MEKERWSSGQKLGTEWWSLVVHLVLFLKGVTSFRCRPDVIQSVRSSLIRVVSRGYPYNGCTHNSRVGDLLVVDEQSPLTLPSWFSEGTRCAADQLAPSPISVIHLVTSPHSKADIAAHYHVSQQWSVVIDVHGQDACIQYAADHCSFLLFAFLDGSSSHF